MITTRPDYLTEREWGAFCEMWRWKRLCQQLLDNPMIERKVAYTLIDSTMKEAWRRAGMTKGVWHHTAQESAWLIALHAVHLPDDDLL